MAVLSGWQRVALLLLAFVVCTSFSGCLTARDTGEVLFDSTRDGRRAVFIMNSDGSNWRRLTSADKRSGLPQWSPDRRRIVFVAEEEGTGTDIYIMNADGSNVVRLTNHKDDDDEPSWSPDGTQIVFESDRDGNSEIYVMNVDDSSVQRLTWSERDDSFPSWSPSGTQILFSADDGPRGEVIYVMNSDGSEPRSLGVGAEPRWSPDGSRIVFISWTDGDGDDANHRTEIYVMNSDGSGVQRLTRNRYVDAGPAWSPDGTRITFHSDREGESGRWQENLEIYVMNADGSQTRRLTFNEVFDAHADW